MTKKKSRIQKFKNLQAQNKSNQAKGHMITRQDMDRMLFDMVMGEIYENSHINSLLFEDILDKYNVQLPHKEKERLWDVLANSMWVSPMMGFGQAGKLELTPQGFQLMSQYGSYTNYLTATQVPISNSHVSSNMQVDQHISNTTDQAQQGREEKKEE